MASREYRSLEAFLRGLRDRAESLRVREKMDRYLSQLDSLEGKRKSYLKRSRELYEYGGNTMAARQDGWKQGYEDGYEQGVTDGFGECFRLMERRRNGEGNDPR